MALRRKRQSSGCLTVFWLLLGLAVLGGTIAYFVVQPDWQQLFGGGTSGEREEAAE
jgi:hypothetical protein